MAFDKLCREVLQNVSEKVRNEEVIHRSVGRLTALHRCCPAQVDSLSNLFDGLRAAGNHPEFQRLAALHRLCDGDGLMAWHGNGDEPVYVVEREVEGFADWLLARTMAFLGRRERDKALSDAVWATLSAGKRSMMGEANFEIRMAPFAEGEAVLIDHRTLGRQVLVFESPWEGEQGRRTHRVIRQLPEGVTPEQVWIWLPGALGPEEDWRITCYMALSRALREGKGGEKEALLTLSGEPYLGASVSALRAITGCYRRGKVVTDQRTWRPNGHRGDLASLLKHLITWAMEEKGSADGVYRGVECASPGLTKGAG